MQADSKFGATKLNKILWWSDFLACAQRGKPITGIEYMTRQRTSTETTLTCP